MTTAGQQSARSNTAENPHAGKGSSVLLDIGGDIGALVIDMPAELEDQEIELRPADGSSLPHSHAHDGTTHTGDSTAGDHHHHDAHQLPHVAVVPRPAPDGGVVYSAVFFEVPAGEYELYVRPDGPVQLTAQITGGQVTNAGWPR